MVILMGRSTGTWPTFASTDFNEALKVLKRLKGAEFENEAKKSIDKTIETLSEKQAEAITLETIYQNLLNGSLKQDHASDILTDLGYRINPSPIKWLKKKLTDLRVWIIDSIRWLKLIGETLELKIKEIKVEIGLIPKVSITFTPS